MIDMEKLPFRFSGNNVDVYFSCEMDRMDTYADSHNLIYVTDENLYTHYARKFPLGKTIILPSGEEHKTQGTVNKAIDELMIMGAGRDSFIVGVGGGIVTDVAGYLASIYMRGIRFGFVPTSILAMVDAAIGGKNGINVGLFKNQIGVIRQPQFLCYDFKMLKTLSSDEWISGFAEIIKHACIADEQMFDFLEKHTINDFKKDERMIADLVQKNVNIKYSIVSSDEHENGHRRLLNFGHTIGHAIEQISELPHGFAISIGMVYACKISEKLNGFDSRLSERVTRLLQRYLLPVKWPLNKEQAWEILLHDKKKTGDHLHFILLEDIGKGVVSKIYLSELKQLFFELDTLTA